MEDLRQRSIVTKSSFLSGKILMKHSFIAKLSGKMAVVLREFKPVYKDSRFLRIICLGLVNLTTILLCAHWCSSTESLCLLSFLYIIIFDFLCLCICALSIWVELKKPNSQYTFGYERVEVLAVFVSTTFSLTSSFFIIKKSIGRWIQQYQIHTSRLFPGLLIAFSCHLLMAFMKNKGLNLVVCASNSSWLQNQIQSLNKSLTYIVPGYSSSSWPRINPFSLLGFCAAAVSVFALIFIDIYDYHSADAIAGIIISTLNCITMLPICAYSSKILLQATPPHVKDLLDKSLREASTLDGVLELRNEHFWLLGFDKIIGTIHVRIRRDANEQVVLSHLLNKLASLVSDITIQVFKDEWTWSSSTRQILNDSYRKFPPVPNTFVLPSDEISTPSNKETLVSINNDTGVSTISLSSYSYPILKSLPQQSHSYASIPLPPSLASSKSSPKSQNVTINMSGSELVPKATDPTARDQSKMQYYLQSPTSTSKYNRELSINPMSSSGPSYLKSYRS